jgi:hypothetical protein
MSVSPIQNVNAAAFTLSSISTNKCHFFPTPLLVLAAASSCERLYTSKSPTVISLFTISAPSEEFALPCFRPRNNADYDVPSQIRAHSQRCRTTRRGGPEGDVRIAHATKNSCMTHAFSGGRSCGWLPFTQDSNREHSSARLHFPRLSWIILVHAVLLEGVFNLVFAAVICTMCCWISPWAAST